MWIAHWATEYKKWKISLVIQLRKNFQLYFLFSTLIFIITVILSYFSLVFGELVPKRVAMKNAEKVDLVITLAERKFEHWLNNADTPLSDDERGLLFSRMDRTSEIDTERSLAVDTNNEKSKISAIYYYDPETRPGLHPLHEAGAYYLQEASAMSAVALLDPQPGERMLDLCAAPGGKSTQIAALLDGKGLLYCNEYVRSRASILLSNIERMGVRNAVLTSLHPDVFRDNMRGVFDRVLVDAPCSGEGMFRRDTDARAETRCTRIQIPAGRDPHGRPRSR